MLFWKDFTTHLGATAVVCGDGDSYSYADLLDLADAWTASLREALGHDGPALVALEMPSTIEAISAYLGCLRADLAVVLAEPHTLGEESPIVQRFAPVLRIRCSEQGEDLNLDHVPNPAAVAPHPDVRVLLSTSGSTGEAKLVKLSGENIHSNAVSISEYLHLTPDERALVTLPLYYSYGLSVLNSHLAVGGRLILTKLSVIEPEFKTCVERHGATSMALVPHQFELLERVDPEMLPMQGMRYVTQAGGRLAPHAIRKFHDIGQVQGWDMVVMYGQTEASPRISYVPPEALPEAADTIGMAVPGGTLTLRDESGQEIVAENVAGELVYSGPNVMMGYASEPKDLSDGKRVTELATGDIAERLPNGLFRIKGRLKRFAKLFGLRLSLDQIEADLTDAGFAARVVSVEERLVIFVTSDEDAVRARRYVMDAYGLPLSHVFAAPIEEHPRLPNGKVDYAALTAMAALVAEDALDASKAESVDLGAILATATRSSEIGREDSFNSLGGDSLGYLQFQMALERQLGRVPRGWENMTLGELTALTPARSRPGKWQKSHLDMEVILRVFAISYVIAQHATDLPLYGGTWMLVLLLGHSACRFQAGHILRGDGRKILTKMLWPIVPLYFGILLAYGLYQGSVPLNYLIFSANYSVPTSSSIVGPYWFVSLFVQIVFLIALVAWIPKLRQAYAGHPHRCVLAALIFALGLHAVTLFMPTGLGFVPPESQYRLLGFPVPHLAGHGLAECLPLFLLGWMFAMEQTARQRWTALALVPATLALFALTQASWGAVAVVAASVILMFWRPIIFAARPLVVALQICAAATLYAYLGHPFIVHFVKHVWALDEVIGPAFAILLAITASFAVSIMVKLMIDQLGKADLKMKMECKSRSNVRTVKG